MTNLHSFADAEFMKELIPLFIESGNKNLRLIRLAMLSEDLKRVAKEAHSLKSASANLGATRLSELCAELERSIHEGEITDYQRKVSELDEEYAKVSSELKRMKAA